MIDATRALDGMQSVSMKSGLEGRNNKSIWDGITSAFESQ